MKTFEERYTAWIDGKLSGPELASFERELETIPEAGDDKVSVQRLGDLLRRHSEAPALSHEDFFSHQIMHRIAAESFAAPPVARRWWSWSLPQLVGAGAASLLLAAVLFKTLIPIESTAPLGAATALYPAGSNYFAEIVDVRTSDPGISATTIYDIKDNVTVLWLDGLDYLPASYKLD